MSTLLVHMHAHTNIHALMHMQTRVKHVQRAAGKPLLRGVSRAPHVCTMHAVGDADRGHRSVDERIEKTVPEGLRITPWHELGAARTPQALTADEAIWRSVRCMWICAWTRAWTRV